MIHKHAFGSGRFLELVAVFVIATSVMGLLALRLEMFLVFQIWIAGILVTYAYSRLAQPLTAKLVPDAPAWHLLLVVGVALMLRFPPFTYLLGGQDQGVYLNMAGEIMRTGALQPVDLVLEAIDSEQVRELYLRSNYLPGSYLPGVYRADDGLEFQFYHLFPVWLALFGAVLGTGGSTYALTLMSLVSLLFIQRLTHLISGSSRAGLAAGLLLAINPLHTFFSRFPVTEVVALAFSAISFTCLYICVYEAEGRAAKRYLALSLLAIGMVFMTRISGFLYLPLILVVLVIGQLVGQRKPECRRLVYWGIGAVFLYAASVLYGLEWSARYAKDIYHISFHPLLGSRWPIWLALGAGLCAIVIVGFGVASWNSRFGRRLEVLLSAAGALLPVLVVAFTAIGMWRAYQLGYTDFYSSHPRIGALADGGIRSTMAVSLVAATVYLSPFLTLAFWTATFGRALTVLMKVVLFFIVCFYGHMAVLQWFLPYQPYYGRYLVSELVPYVLVFVVSFWSVLRPSKLRRFLGGMLLLCGAYSLFVSVQQVGKSEHDGLPLQLERLAELFDESDLIVIDRDLDRPSVNELKTPLIYTYGLSTVTAPLHEMAAGGFARGMASSYRDVYFVTGKPVNTPERFVEIDSVAFRERIFCRGNTLPVSLCTRNDTRLNVYKLVAKPEPGAKIMELRAGNKVVSTVVGIKQNGELRAAGKAGFLMFGPYAPLPSGQYSLIVEGETTRPFRIDVVASKGAQVMARQDVSRNVASKGAVLVRLDFEVAESVSDLEVRIVVPGDSDMIVSGYRIESR